MSASNCVNPIVPCTGSVTVFVNFSWAMAKNGARDAARRGPNVHISFSLALREPHRLVCLRWRLLEVRRSRCILLQMIHADINPHRKMRLLCTHDLLSFVDAFPTDANKEIERRQQFVPVGKSQLDVRRLRQQLTRLLQSTSKPIVQHTRLARLVTGGECAIEGVVILRKIRRIRATNIPRVPVPEVSPKYLPQIDHFLESHSVILGGNRRLLTHFIKEQL